jgi:hypothetical protein
MASTSSPQNSQPSARHSYHIWPRKLSKTVGPRPWLAKGGHDRGAISITGTYHCRRTVPMSLQWTSGGEFNQRYA